MKMGKVHTSIQLIPCLKQSSGNGRIKYNHKHAI